MRAHGLELRRDEASRALGLLYGHLRERGFGAPAGAEGQLIRPLLSMAGAESLGRKRDGVFWAATAAVQLAHEASLLHDDVIDESAVRRGAPTLAARGVAHALVEGDHLLTTSYRLAATTDSAPFVSAFAHAVERTVAGEKQQGRTCGLTLDERTYRGIIAGKSGELLGCALAAAAYVDGAAAASSLYVLGRRTGELYQMLDDLLDYCPDVDTGKPALGDYGQRRWTWPLLELTVDGFTEAPDLIAERFAREDERGTSPLRRCLARFEREVDGVRAAIAVHMPQDEILTQLVQDWLARAIAAVHQVEAAQARRRGRAELMRRVPSGPSLHSFFAANSRTFSFAARAFPRAFRDSVAGVYAFCRVTDDIADGPEAPADGMTRAELLDLWRDLAHDAHAGSESGLPLLDRVMREAALAGVPFTYVDDLVEGMRMDLHGRRYASLEDLHVYSHRVAGVVGQWLTRLAGVHDPTVLERAADLGHAMQLTNIVRDVGEDLRAGRIYLPADVMDDADVDAADLQAFAEGAPVTRGYRDVLETLMARADEHYAAALEATRSLPPWFRRAVVVAAHVYRGIHDQVRANGHDNFSRRAHTTVTGKVYLAVKALGGARLEPSVQSRPLAVPVADAVRDQAAPRTLRARTPTVALLLIIAATLPTAVRAQTAPDRAAVRSVSCDTAHMDAHSRVVDNTPCTEPEQQIDHIRSLFFRAVTDESAIRAGHAMVAEARAALPEGDDVAAVLLAYEGAFTALEAKHGSWALARFLTVRSALSLLDAAVEAAPDDLEIRYLRAVNGVHLPSLFGRGDVAQRDLEVLTRDAPAARDAYDAGVYSALAELVLEHGSPTAADRALLHAAILQDTTPQAGESARHE